MVLDIARETGGPVVDLGAGTGRLTIPLLNEGLEVYAVESDPRMSGRSAGEGERASR